MITINSNASALMAQNNLNTNQSNLQGNMLQLSTGLRINSASDDAAGMQISNRMGTQMNGLGVAQRNANDAISMAQTAEGAMTENNNILNRMRDLSLQSANDTNTLEDRQAMQKEVEALVSEVDRIASTTNFAGINLLDGSASDMTFQIGSNAGETISFGVDSMFAKDLGATVQAGEVEGVEFTDGKLDNPLAFEVEGEKIVLESGLSGYEAANQLNEKFSAAGVNATAVFDDETSSLQLVAEEAVMSEITVSVGRDGILGGNPGNNPLPGLPEDDENHGTDKPDADDDTSISEGTFSVSGSNGGITNLEDLSVENIDLTTSAGAQKAAVVLDSALASIDEQRADLGAVQNRLESTISNLSNIEENLGVSQSRILDADFASQTVEMTSNQMLMQAGTSVLAQAKTMPQYATMLL